jgi:serine/threonine protein kinase
MLPEQQQEIRRIFAKAIAVPGRERMAYLRETCAGRPEVFEEVARLLDAHDEVQSLLIEPSAIVGTETTESRRIGRYVIYKRLGHGAMGTVYEARDPKLARKIALKTINVQGLSGGDEEFLKNRLRIEARAASALSHPGIVTIYDIDEADGAPFITMELVDGKSIQDRLNEGTMFSVPQVIDIVRQSAAALDFAYDRNIVHRDIKPGNIMLQDNGIVKIADFGIAKIKSPGTMSTQHSVIMGTPAYMSPEQQAGAELSGRSDQYSLAVFAYQLFTGRLPFQTAVGSRDQLSVCTANPALPAALDTPLRRALALSPDDRFPTCREFAEALEQSVRVEPRITPPPSPPPLPAPGPVKPPGPSRLAAVLGACAAILVLAAGAWLYRNHSKPTPSLSPAVLRFSAAPAKVQPGQPATLRWEVSDASRVIINQGIGKVAATGAVEVRPLVTTPYVLTASGSGSEKTETAVVEVEHTPAPTPTPTPSAAAPVIETFQAEPPEVAANEKFQLTWSVKGASNISIDPGSITGAAQGRMPLTEGRTTTYMITATPEGGGPAVTQSLTVPVRAKPELANKPPRDPHQLYVEALLKRRSDPTQAALLFRQAADLGDPMAMLEAGKMFLTGDGVKADPEAAGRWLRKSGEAGNAAAMVLLGTMYSEGKGVPRNDNQAVAWFRRAANLGDKRGMDNLGDMYLKGRGVDKDPSEAIQWYKKAAAAGSATAMFHLGLMYEQGTGVPKNIDEAKTLYHDAGLLGSADARARLEQLPVPRTDSGAAEPVALTGMQPQFIAERQMRQYRLIGSGLSLRTTIYLDVPGFVGSRQDRPANYRPAEAASDGTWLKVFFLIERQPPGKRIRISVRNNGSREAFLDVPVAH